MSHAINVTNLSKRVQLPSSELCILDQVSFSIEQGQTLAIVGASGSGKSTLLALMAGLDTASEGHVEILGINLNSLDEDGRAKLRGEKVGFVFQSFQLLPALSALENVMLPLELRGDNNPEHAAREILQRVGLGERLDHYPRQLSGGEQQRVAIARAFVVRPAVLFADEPTGNLDADNSWQVIKILKKLHAIGITVIVTTHDESLIRLSNHPVVQIRNGHLYHSQPKL